MRTTSVISIVSTLSAASAFAPTSEMSFRSSSQLSAEKGDDKMSKAPVYNCD